MRWPAWSQEESNLAPSASSTRMPQTKSAARTSFSEIAFKMRLLASCHFSTDPSESVGSSSVRASWGRAELLGELFGAAVCEKSESRKAGGKNGEQTAAEALFIPSERNLRRFMAITSLKRLHPSSRTQKQRGERACGG